MYLEDMICLGNNRNSDRAENDSVRKKFIQTDFLFICNKERKCQHKTPGLPTTILTVTAFNQQNFNVNFLKKYISLY